MDDNNDKITDIYNEKRKNFESTDNGKTRSKNKAIY